MSKTFVAATLAALAVASAASGAVVAGWTFETSVPATSGPFAAENGVNAASSFATGFHTSGATAYSNPAGNGSAESFSSNNWSAGDYYQFTTSTVGYQNIGISFDQTRSGTGPADFRIAISVDGGATFGDILTYTVLANTNPPGFWSSSGSRIADYLVSSNIATGSNAASLTVRLISNVTTSGGGTNRVDNVSITGDLVPTPGAASLLALGGLAAIRRRR